MFPWTLHRWHEVLSPERDRVPCWCFCVQIQWELGLLTISRKTLTSPTMFIGFSLWGVSYAAFPLWFGIIYELSSGRKRAISPRSTPSVHDVSWLAAASQIWNTLTARENPSKCEGKCLKTQIRGVKKGSRTVSMGTNHLGETKRHRLRYIRNQTNGVWIVGLCEIRR